MTATEQEPGGANGIINHNGNDNNGSTASATEPLIPKTDIGLERLCARIHGVVTRFLNREAESELLGNVQQKTKEAIGVIEKALDSYSISQLSLSYNGGKDCLVLLVLYLHALYSHHLRQSTSTDRSCNENDLHFRSIQSVYIKTPHPFPEVEAFVHESEQIYSLTLKRYTIPMKPAFTNYLDENPCVKAIFVGTRRTDPHGANLTHFDETDHGWPSFMRIHPVIDWHYVEIWALIKYFNIPYCPLYDMGYTSLGGTNDTKPNPALRLPGSTPIEPKFRPAHDLVLDEEERLGRDFLKKPGEGQSSQLPVVEKKNLF